MELEILRRAPLFRGLNDEAVHALAAAMHSLHFRRGTVLFHEGVPGNQLYVIVSGKVKLGRHAASTGRESLLSVLGPGEMFGELSAFDPGPRSTTATAIVETEVRMLEHDELFKWLSVRPEVAGAMLGQLAGRLRHANDVVSDMVFSDVTGRVAKQLLDLADRFGVRGEDGALTVRHELTQEELAQLVGASRETVNKALAEFSARGWVQLQQRTVVILDRDQLLARTR